MQTKLLKSKWPVGELTKKHDLRSKTPIPAYESEQLEKNDPNYISMLKMLDTSIKIPPELQ